MKNKVLMGALALVVAGGFAASYAVASDKAEEAKKAEAAKPEEAKEKKDYVLVKYMGRSLNKSDVEKEIATSVPGGAQMDFSAFPAPMQDNILRNIVSQKIIYDEAVKAGTDSSEELKSRFETIKRQLVMDLYLRNKAKELVKDEDLKKMYEEKSKQHVGKDELKASHILVESEKDAKELYKKIKGGADFGEIAKEKSKDPSSGANGGDLGYFTEDQMVKEFSKAAFKLKPGEVSQPVKTEFGWHIIKVTEKRKSSAPSFEEMKPSLLAEVEGKAVGKYLNEVFDKANVEVMDEQGKGRKLASMPEAAPAPAPAAAPAEDTKKQ